MRRAVLTLALALPLLVACQLSLPGRERPVAAPADVTGGTITTTSLDAVPAPDAAEVAPAESGTAAAAQTPAEAPIPAEEAAEAAVDAGAEAPAPPPAPAKSPLQMACEEDGGIWARAGDGGGMACVRTTRDSGKQCRSKTDCEGECLARSRTCAPVQPLFGCNAVLMDNGAEVNLCID
jgi:hypothetical protein